MDTKIFLRSKTIIGVIVAALPALLPALGVSFSPDDGAFITDAIDAIFTGIGSALAIYGRFVAKTPVTVTPK